MSPASIFAGDTAVVKKSHAIIDIGYLDTHHGGKPIANDAVKAHESGVKMMFYIPNRDG
jgi:hypothetical protein